MPRLSSLFIHVFLHNFVTLHNKIYALFPLVDGFGLSGKIMTRKPAAGKMCFYAPRVKIKIMLLRLSRALLSYNDAGVNTLFSSNRCAAAEGIKILFCRAN